MFHALLKSFRSPDYFRFGLLNLGQHHFQSKSPFSPREFPLSVEEEEERTSLCVQLLICFQAPLP